MRRPVTPLGMRILMLYVSYLFSQPWPTLKLASTVAFAYGPLAVTPTCACARPAESRQPSAAATDMKLLRIDLLLQSACASYRRRAREEMRSVVARQYGAHVHVRARLSRCDLLSQAHV